MLEENLKEVRQKVISACGRCNRDPKDITIVGVSKGVAPDFIKQAFSCGIVNIGENRVQEASLKYKLLAQNAKLPIIWHMVGHLQANKVKPAVRMFSLIHSVDSYKLARVIDEEAKKINKIQDILIEVNTSGEAVKFGVAVDKAHALAEEISKLKNIVVKGLMTVGPLTRDKDKIRQAFKTLAGLNNKKFPIISMGMSDDFEIAVEEGANMLRLGKALFKTVSTPGVEMERRADDE